MEIAACRAQHIEVLERLMPSHSVDGHHAARFARQEAGRSTYLIPWPDGRPVGHAEIRWTGCEAPEVRAADALGAERYGPDEQAVDLRAARDTPGSRRRPA
ncbi:hypothetical protein [Streptomyces sp. NPDC057002]|uniref:hypothetical protein n=1 Tax=Streptomyces sp. NPDC057002 TaxID=3345992 RepID=UPI003643F2D0